MTLLRMMRRLLMGSFLACACAGASIDAASAAPTVLAPVANDSALSAHGGWVVWSEQGADGRWALTAWHDGAKTRLPVRTRTVPFDVDLGSDAHGRSVATYSRCKTEPAVSVTQAGSVGYAGPNGLVNWSGAAGCHLRVLDLADGSERALQISRPHGASDTTPSMWRGRVAFARMNAGATIAQVMLFTPSSGQVRRLRHGAVPTNCPFKGGCKGFVSRATVQQLDLGARAVAFVWDVRAPAVIGAGDGWELRADRLSDGASRVFGSGYQSGACGARYPVSPNVVGSLVWFDEIHFNCDTPHTTALVGDIAGDDYGRANETTPLVAWQIVRDGSTEFSIRGPRTLAPGSDDAPCLGDGGGCSLVADSVPSTPPIDVPAHSPFF